MGSSPLSVTRTGLRDTAGCPLGHLGRRVSA